MTITVQPEPAGGRDVINTALRSRSHRSRDISALRGAPQTTAPLPIYILKRDDLSRKNPLSAAKLVGWIYLIVGGAAPGTAYLKMSPSLEFSGISYGIFPQRLVDAVALADRDLSPRPEKFQMRLLDIPACRTSAIWLEGPSRFFISLMDGQPPGSAPLKLDARFLGGLSGSSRAGKSISPRLGGPPTN
jgi:hypothetical protein